MKVKHLENLMKKERFFGSRAMGRHGPVKLVVLTGRHGTEKRPVGRALGQRRGTSMAVARHGRHGGPCRHDATSARHGPPGRAGTARCPSIAVLQLAGFVVVCEAFLGIAPNKDLFWRVFEVKTCKVHGFDGDVLAPVGRMNL